MERKKIRVNITLWEDQVVAVKRVLARRETNLSQILRKLLDQYLLETK